jgi:hypothetical protein
MGEYTLKRFMLNLAASLPLSMISSFTTVYWPSQQGSLSFLLLQPGKVELLIKIRYFSIQTYDACSSR